MTNDLEINVVRGDGRIAPVPHDGNDLLVACRKALEVSRTLVAHGCPFGDRIPPRSVNIHENGRLMFSIAIQPASEP